MKTKELIRQLQEIDPTGEIECCVDNADIFFLERIPAYYDGCLEVLQRDEACKYYNIIGAEIRSGGDKVKIRTLSIEDALWNDPDLPIKFSEYSERHSAKWVEKVRQEVREFNETLGKD